MAIRLVIGITLITASLPKLKDPAKFAAGVIQYKVLPMKLARAYGYLLPLAEMLVGTLLIIGIRVPIVSAASAIMFGSFGFAVVVNLLRKSEMPCYCFGASESLGWNTLVRIVVLLALSILLALLVPVESEAHDMTPLPLTGTFAYAIPIISLVLFGLLMLEFVRVSPVILRAWTARPTRRVAREFGVVWTRETSEDGR
ncbi:MAG: MauE/DoxX family redox-associated membrane protein [Anaerolineales bacterium]